MEDEYKIFERELMEKEKKVQELVERIQKIREEIPDDHEHADRIREEWHKAEKELHDLVGDDEFKRRTGRDYLKGDL